MPNRNFRGRTSWDYISGSDKPPEITNGIIRQNGLEIAIEFKHADGTYTVSLQRTPENSTYRGQFTYRSGGHLSTGTAHCKLFTSDDDMILFGRWVEDNTTYLWWVEIDEDE